MNKRAGAGVLVFALLSSAGAAQALSCLKPDIVRTYREAAESKDRFVVVTGTLTFDEALMPVVDMDNQAQTPPETGIPARLVGHALDWSGFVSPYDQEITLNVQCYGPWCAWAESGGDYLAFVNLDKAPPEVAITPCGGFAFAEPTPEMEQEVIRCRNGAACEPAFD